MFVPGMVAKQGNGCPPSEVRLTANRVSDEAYRECLLCQEDLRRTTNHTGDRNCGGFGFFMQLVDALGGY